MYLKGLCHSHCKHCTLLFAVFTLGNSFRLLENNYTNFELTIDCFYLGCAHNSVSAQFKIYFYKLKTKNNNCGSKILFDLKNSLSSLRANVNGDPFT